MLPSFALQCGHRQCNECWKAYVNVGIQKGPACIATPCFWQKCTLVLPEDVVTRFASEVELERYVEEKVAKKGKRNTHE
jgi:hypothetical protein